MEVIQAAEAPSCWWICWELCLWGGWATQWMNDNIVWWNVEIM